MDVIGIYYAHFGSENLRERKRHYACALLFKKKDEIRMCMDHISWCTTIDKVCLQLKHLGERLDGHLPDQSVGVMTSTQRLRTCYRNHIYPAEVDTPSSAFYKADIRLIDAILIDRDPSVEEHNRTRGGRWRFILKFDTEAP